MDFPINAVITASAPTIAVIVGSIINSRGQRKIRRNQEAIHHGLAKQAVAMGAPLPPPLPAPSSKSATAPKTPPD